MFTAVLCAGEGGRYVARFPTRPNGRYCTVRLPWALFRSEIEGAAPLEPAAVTHIGLRYELRRTPQAPPVTGAQQQPGQQPMQQPGLRAQQPPQLFVPEGARLPEGANSALKARSMQLQQQRAQQQEQRFARFSLEVDWIKALPAGIEPEFVLVSCAGSADRPGMSLDDLNRVVAAKRKGEDSLRASGLGYTIIRPGPLVVSGVSSCAGSYLIWPSQLGDTAAAVLLTLAGDSYSLMSSGSFYWSVVRTAPIRLCALATILSTTSKSGVVSSADF